VHNHVTNILQEVQLAQLYRLTVEARDAGFGAFPDAQRPLLVPVMGPPSHAAGTQRLLQQPPSQAIRYFPAGSGRPHHAPRCALEKR
jgi:hypothetical protein